MSVRILCGFIFILFVSYSIEYVCDGFRTVINKNGKNHVYFSVGHFFNICCYSGNKNTSSVNISTDLISQSMRYSLETHGHTDGRRSLSDRVPKVLPFWYGTIKIIIFIYVSILDNIILSLTT